MRHIILMLLLFSVLLSCATTNLPPVTQNIIFEQDEERLWARAEEEEEVLDKSGLLYRDEELEDYLFEVAKNIQPSDVFESIPFKIMVIKNHLLNAFAYPNGNIYIHTGLLARMENEAQLATLIAHEMTHCTHRHMVKQFREVKNMTAFLATVQVTVGGLGGGIGDLSTLLGALGSMAAVSGYSKDLETEADMEGLKAIVKAGYDFNEAPKLFMHLKQDIEEEEIKEPFFFGTHPRIQERINNYESFIKEQYNEESGGVINEEIFLDKVADVILENAGLDLKAGRFKIAQRGTEKYLAIKPDNAKGHCLLGDIFRQKGEEDNMEEAKIYYQKAISIDPVYPEPYKGIGIILYKKGDKLNAKNFLEQYLSLDSEALDRGYIEEYIKDCYEGGGQ